MSSHRITAYHEAAHAVVAYLSQYHGLIGGLSLTSPETGDALIRLSRKKLLAAGKQVDNTALDDPEVRIDAAVIRLAGYAAEEHYASMHPDQDVEPNKSFSANDYAEARGLIGDAGVRRLEPQVRALVSSEWAAIQALAAKLEAEGVLEAIDALDLLNAGYGRNDL
jgi:hypothetical protein